MKKILLVTAMQSGAAAIPKYLAGGIDLSNVAGAWEPQGAASLAASYLRLAGDQGNANLDPAVVGAGSAPSWSALNGWVFNGIGQFLDTGIKYGANWSVFVAFSNTTVDSVTKLALGSGGSNLAGEPAMAIAPIRSTNTESRFIQGAATIITLTFGQVVTGTMAISRVTTYINGVKQTGSLGALSVALARNLYVGGANGGGSLYLPYKGEIAALYVYKTPITDLQVEALNANFT